MILVCPRIFRVTACNGLLDLFDFKFKFIARLQLVIILVGQCNKQIAPHYRLASVLIAYSFLHCKLTNIL